jgi:hypothetical protein
MCIHAKYKKIRKSKKKSKLKKIKYLKDLRLGITAPAYKTSYSGGRDREDPSLGPARSKRKQDLQTEHDSAPLSSQLFRRQRKEDHSLRLAQKENHKPSQKNNLKQKGLEIWLKW